MLLVVALALTACDVGWRDAVHRSRPPAAQVRIQAPQYTALTDDGYLVRRGTHRALLPHVGEAFRLNDGRLLLQVRHRPATCPGGVTGDCDRFPPRVLDLARNTLMRPPTVSDGAMTWPGQGVNRLEFGPHPNRLVSLAPDLTDRRTLRLPSHRGELAGEDFGRTFAETAQHRRRLDVRQGEGDEERTEEYGYLRLRGGRAAKVLAGRRMVALWVSADGRSLLGLQQIRGEPCGGCVVGQRIVEIDPSSGEIAATYGVPGDYREQWRVDRIDKVGDRVAVRYAGRCVSGVLGCHERQYGTWVYDDRGWNVVPGSTRQVTWWQGRDDRVVATVLSTKDTYGDGLRLSWVHEGTRQSLEGDLFRVDRTRDPVDGRTTVAGGLLRPLP